MMQNGKLKAWSQGVTFHGPTALGVTTRSGGAKPPRGRPRAPDAKWGDSAELSHNTGGYAAASSSRASAHLSSDEGGFREQDGVEEASALIPAVDAAEYQAALLDRATRLVELLKKADIKPPAGMPQGGTVVGEDNALLFLARLVQMLRERPAEEAAPQIAYHWTAESNFQSIAESNLRVPDGANVKKKHGAAFGRGIYCSPDFHFAREDFSYGASATFLCLVLPGKQMHRNPGQARNQQDLPRGFDSVKGRVPGRPCDTWVLPSSEQVLPCYLVDELALPDALRVVRAAIALLCEPWPAQMVEKPKPQPPASSHANGTGDDAAASQGRWRARRGADGQQVFVDGDRDLGLADSQRASGSAPSAASTSASGHSSQGKGRWRGGAKDAAQANAPGTSLSAVDEGLSVADANVVTVAGDLCAAAEMVIVHQCCCVISKPAQGVAAAIFSKFPEADPYRQRRERGRPIDTPGSVMLQGRVANLFGQFCPGKPLEKKSQISKSSYAEHFARFPQMTDSREERFAWFQQSLEELHRQLQSRLQAAGGPITLAMPARIGCGLAAGHWPTYLKAIREFSGRHGYGIAIYDIEGAPGQVCKSTGQVGLCMEERCRMLAAARAPARTPHAGRQRAHPAFWASASFELRCPQRGCWLQYPAEVQTQLQKELRQAHQQDQSDEPSTAESASENRSLQCRILVPWAFSGRPMTASSGGVDESPPTATVEIQLDVVALATGRARQRLLGTDVVCPVRLNIPPASTGECVMPAESDEGSTGETVSLSDCGRLLSAEQVASTPNADTSCAVCCDDFANDGVDVRVCTLRCNHTFHEKCLTEWFKERPQCPTCKRRYGKVIGTQPRVGSMGWQLERESLPGHAGDYTIVLVFDFPSGKDEDGQPYDHRRQRAYLPDDVPGRLLLQLFRLAFRRRVMFGLGLSMTLAVRRATFNVHVKTSRTGGATKHGFPDDDYFARAIEELSSNGVTVGQLE
eukprot:TRINITY_DN36045_c0_g1_i2.p1 TRINITY_DN36045_c0_g1~~TRINITY_DN36045_c0_g1_i2.p1  ORF type:complete len:977 (-),score=131.76 TRINITY_DN36045_c0_g1_i2:137-3067(-)